MSFSEWVQALALVVAAVALAWVVVITTWATGFSGPFGLVVLSALLLLIATGIPLGVASLIGVLMLIGIVVTNAIVLIDLVNQQRDEGRPLRDAVIGGSSLRLRPIVMTALATILALTPMGIGISIVIAIVAALSLAIDFAFIDRGTQAHGPGRGTSGHQQG